MRQIHQVVVDGSECCKFGHKVGQSNWDLYDTIVADIKNLQIGKLGTAELLYICQLIHMKVELLESGHIFADGWDLVDLVPVDRKVTQIVEPDVTATDRFSSARIRLKEVHNIVLIELKRLQG